MRFGKMGFDLKHSKYDVGYTVGKWVVVSKNYDSDKETWKYDLKCFCGLDFIKTQESLSLSKGCCRHVFENLKVGSRYEKLTLVEKIRCKGGNKVNCICDCGKDVIMSYRSFGVTKSCGCIVYEVNSKRAKHGKTKSKTYKTWVSMLGRVKEGNIRTKDYFDRGIDVCDDWKSFENFYRDMGDKPEGMSIDRIDNNKGYCKENCKWSDDSDQMSNRRSSRNKSGRIGVRWDSNRNKWEVRIRKNGSVYRLGRYSDFNEACDKIEEAELKYLGYSRKGY